MELYNHERFNNWLNRLRETDVDTEKAESFAVFDQMVEDFVVACLNIIKAVKNREIKKSDGISEIDKMNELLNVKVDLGDEIKNEFFEFTKEGLKAVLQSFRYYLDGKSSKKDFEALLKDAVNREKKGDLEGALDLIARMGVKVLKGEKLPEDIEIPEDSIVLNWLDGIDAINTALILSEIDVANASEE
ncbi:DUF2150 domain-containing protein [Archaeoglobales archaeon]|nr:MAG: DUF2150 domain-containing protein [Archaeoglobales archaeon]